MIEVLKFGSSVLRSPSDLHVAVDEIYRRWRGGCRVIAVVSAFEGVTDTLVADVTEYLGTECPEATAAYVATGEQQTAALLQGSLQQYGMPSRLIEPRQIGLRSSGSPLESTPVGVDAATIEALWDAHPILVLPGFYGIDVQGGVTLFGRGGSDLSAIFLAAALHGECRLLKDVSGVFDADPAQSDSAHRFAELPWAKAVEVAGPLIQSKALRFAQDHGLAFEVGRPNENSATLVGAAVDAWSAVSGEPKPVRVALLGCGAVGRGVYETLKRYPGRFEIRCVVVRDVEKYQGVEHLTTDASLALDARVDVVVVCFGGVANVYPLIAAALSKGKYVVTANKAVIAARGPALNPWIRGADQRLWYSAAVGGAVPVLETLSGLDTPVQAIRGIVNGTCGVVLDALCAGRSQAEAITLAQAAGFAEADPLRDLTGLDSADKLVLMIGAGFNEWVDPDTIATHGLDAIVGDPIGYKLVARVKRTWPGVVATVGPEILSPDSFLGQARGAENRVEIELVSGDVIRLKGQGAGRWPTTVAVLGDLHEIARQFERRTAVRPAI
jgi:homoserine dehydrogenase